LIHIHIFPPSAGDLGTATERDIPGQRGQRDGLCTGGGHGGYEISAISLEKLVDSGHIKVKNLGQSGERNRW